MKVTNSVPLLIVNSIVLLLMGGIIATSMARVEAKKATSSDFVYAIAAGIISLLFVLLLIFP